MKYVKSLITGLFVLSAFLFSDTTLMGQHRGGNCPACGSQLESCLPAEATIEGSGSGGTSQHGGMGVSSVNTFTVNTSNVPQNKMGNVRGCVNAFNACITAQGCHDVYPMAVIG